MGTNKITYLDRTFEAHDVISGNAYYARPLNSATLEIDTFSFDEQSDDTSLTEFIRNTPLTFYHDGNQMGIFYVQTISRTSINTYHFTCTSTVGLLDETYHDGGIYTGETVREVCTDICAPLTCYVKSNIANIKLYGWLPIATRRENLAQVLFAIGATLKVDYNGAIRIEGLWDGQSSEITASEMYAGGSVEYATPVTEVIVTEHAYSQSTTEVTELFNGTTSAGDKITFDDPYYDLEATGFEITESGANYAIVTAGSGVLNGKKYTHVTRQIITPTNTSSRSLIEQSDNTVKVESATLVSLVNANAVAERLAEYYSHNERINNKIAVKRETPGDVVKISHPYGGDVVGCIESTDATVSSRLAAQESVLVGYKPQNIGEQEYYDTVEVLTESGTWIPPDGVSSVTAVLIGGGQGGSAGERGHDGNKDSSIYSSGSTAANRATYHGFSTGGDGGEPGTPGHGGKILQQRIAVQAGEQIPFVIGLGGSGGISNSAAGEDGSPSTFGELTSEDGSYTESGFTDTFDGTEYAQPGISDGVKGGKGTSGNGDSSVKLVTETVTYKGVEYQPGNTVVDRVQERYSSGSGTKGTIFLYNGLGGGACAGANGHDGESAAKEPEYGDGYSYLSGAKSGTGGTPPKRSEIPAMRGRGGYPGHGGGGGGGQTAYTTNTIGYYRDYYAREPSPGDGGAGGAGGDGAPGCILLYYRRPKAGTVSGAVRDKNGKIISDKYGRRLVV